MFYIWAYDPFWVYLCKNCTICIFLLMNVQLFQGHWLKTLLILIELPLLLCQREIKPTDYISIGLFIYEFSVLLRWHASVFFCKTGERDHGQLMPFSRKMLGRIYQLNHMNIMLLGGMVINYWLNFISRHRLIQIISLFEFW